MPSFVPPGSRPRVAAAFLASAACFGAGIAAVAACLTAPPPDIVTSTNERPSIVGASVQPPEGTLYGWPPDDLFLVPVQLPDPNAACTWRLFDKDLESNPTVPPVFRAEQPCSTSVSDGGVIVQAVTISQPTDGHCHAFTFIVAHGFSAAEVPDSIGGDSLVWYDEPPGALCNFYDAGALQDGAFPPVDAGADGVPVTPESGSTPESGVDP